MKKQKDIFALFRENEHKLDQAPPKDVWERLENKLDIHQSRPRTSAKYLILRKWLSIAAVSVFVVVAMLGLRLMLQSQNHKMAFAGRSIPHPFYVEEFSMQVANKQLTRNINLYQQHIKKLNTNPFLEGDPSKKLRIRQRLFVAKADSPKRKSIKRREVRTLPMKEISASKSASKYMVVAEESSPMATLHTEDLSKNDAESDLSLAASATPPDSYSKVEGVDEMKMESASASTSIKVRLALDWLIGQWEASDKDKEAISMTVEKKKLKLSKHKRNPSAKARSKSSDAMVPLYAVWTKPNPTTLEGLHYALIHGDTLITKLLRLNLADRKLQIHYTLPSSQTSMSNYRLAYISEDGHSLLFAGENIEDTVILKYNEESKTLYYRIKDYNSLSREYFLFKE